MLHPPANHAKLLAFGREMARVEETAKIHTLADSLKIIARTPSGKPTVIAFVEAAVRHGIADPE